MCVACERDHVILRPPSLYFLKMMGEKRWSSLYFSLGSRLVRGIETMRNEIQSFLVIGMKKKKWNAFMKEEKVWGKLVPPLLQGNYFPYLLL